MKLVAPATLTPAAVAPAPRKRRSSGTRDGTGANGKSFTADVTFTGKEAGSRFVNKHTVDVKASTIFGAMGRAVRNAMPLEKKNHTSKCKWFEISVVVGPADE